MKHLFSWLFLLGLTLSSCQDDNEIFFENLLEGEGTDALHTRFRDQPYPKENNTVYLNPPPFLVPEAARAADGYLEYEISQDETFQSEATIRSGKEACNFFNVHQELALGKWYWHFRAVAADGSRGPWSESYSFEMTGEQVVFVTPEFSDFESNIPAIGKRVMSFIEEDLKDYTPITSAHIAYSDLTSRANGNNGLKYDYTKNSPFGMYVTELYTAMRTIKDEKYETKLRDFTHFLGSYKLSNDQMKGIKGDDFTLSNVMGIYTLLYDYFYHELDEAEKQHMETIMLEVVEAYHAKYRGQFESKMFDNHGWQVGIQAFTQTAFTICDKYPEAMDALEYAYELWIARAPNTGFNMDGSWINGNNYFSVNFNTLLWMPMTFKHVTGFDFLQHPWYKNCGKSLIYSWLPGQESNSFGDGVGKYGYNVYNQAAFADFLAREIHDPYAAWYAGECEREAGVNNKVLNYKARERNLRLYRLAREHVSYRVDELEEGALDNFSWNKDAGYGTLHSNMTQRATNLTVAFRSSPFGSGSHTFSDQNSFKLLYKGYYVYTNVGRYGDPDKYGAPHDILQYRNTRGHNTVMINGIGQPFTTKAYGLIARGLNGDNLGYFLGDASNAYCGTSDYWEDRFQAAGLSQTPAYGFGDNPLNTYKRHIFMLRPNKVVIYDELGADEPAMWQWLLHSPNKFDIKGSKLTTEYEFDGMKFSSVAQIFSNDKSAISEHNQWFPGGEPVQEISKPWHLTAEFGRSAHVKVLTVIQIVDENFDEEPIWQTDNRLLMGEWKINAELSGNAPAAISIVNESTGTAFAYGCDVTVGGETYSHSQTGSSLLVDTKNGNKQVQEIADMPIPVTRALAAQK